MGTYGYDADFLKKNNIEYLELKSKDGSARVLVVPKYQGRVMTTSANGNEGASFGWINYKLIELGEINPQFNPVGGEERFWIGPEGGPFSIYFKQGQKQVYENWKVPSCIDTEEFELKGKKDNSLKFIKETTLTNASGTSFEINIERTVSLLSAKQISSAFNIEISDSVNFVGYQTDNKITNKGNNAWIKESGLISIWMLGMFNPTPTTTVFIPYNTQAKDAVVNDDYFGKVPADRLKTENGFIYFKIDGAYRSKIGVSPERATGICGSYDSQKKALTVLWCSVPPKKQAYVNSKWGEQENPYEGDLINSYNDGPTEDGTVMGPFYEIETSSPAADLLPGQSIQHTQRVVHFSGNEDELAVIVKKIFDIELNIITSRF
ncbi:MAG: DUF6786 family protein [Paludibacter sp.]|nr:DUF6786 family protein [Paludibacter sp.]